MHFNLSVFYFLFILFNSHSVHSALITETTSNIFLPPGNTDKEIRDKILAEFYLWEGVKYKFGGTSIHGIDCSSLIQKIYHRAFSDSLQIKLPRTTAQQIKHGSHTPKSRLKPGDLVFFKMPDNGRHVGIYIGNEQFIHASTSKGVTISDLSNVFWKMHYTTARRILT